MHLNHATATATMANYQHYAAPPQISTHGVVASAAPTTVQAQATIATAQIQQNPFTLHQLTAVQAIQHPTHQAMLHPQHPLVHLLDISSPTSTPNPTAVSPASKVELQDDDKVQEVKVKVEVDDPRKKKQCHVCNNKFRQLTTLRNHMKIHTNERPYKCKHCDKAFRQISTLTNHVKIHTGEKPFTCNICARDFRQQSTLINHIKTHKAKKEPETPAPATIINYQPSPPKQFRTKAHAIVHANQAQYQANRQPISKSLYSGSYSSPQAEELCKPYQCTVCKRRFPQLSTLQNHERTHIDPKPYKCDSCDKSFSQLATLANHKKIHSGDKPYSCQYCSMQFRQQSTLNNHMKTHANANANANNAAANNLAGNAVLQQAHNIQANITIHTGQQQAQQQQQQHQQQQQQQNLTHINAANMLHQQLQIDHPLLHILDSNTTVSTIVPKDQYSNSSQLSNNNESSDRPFACSICRRAFSQQSTLINHIKTHTGEKPYKCKICDTNFRQLSTLNNHTKIHTGEKPYACSYCPKHFRQKSTLVNHIRIHTC